MPAGGYNFRACLCLGRAILSEGLGLLLYQVWLSYDNPVFFLRCTTVRDDLANLWKLCVYVFFCFNPPAGALFSCGLEVDSLVLKTRESRALQGDMVGGFSPVHQ